MICWRIKNFRIWAVTATTKITFNYRIRFPTLASPSAFRNFSRRLYIYCITSISVVVIARVLKKSTCKTTLSCVGCSFMVSCSYVVSYTMHSPSFQYLRSGPTRIQALEPEWRTTRTCEFSIEISTICSQGWSTEGSYLPELGSPFGTSATYCYHHCGAEFRIGVVVGWSRRFFLQEELFRESLWLSGKDDKENLGYDCRCRTIRESSNHSHSSY